MSGELLVTGSSGFIGSRLCEKAIDNNWHVRRVLRDKSKSDGVVVGDINADTDWGIALDNIDCVIHLAARVHVMKDADESPLNAFRETNVDGTLNLARQAAAKGVRRFVYMSSIKVNGEFSLPGKPFSAEDKPCPSDPYAISKYEAEMGLLALSNETAMEVTIIRPPLVYGPGVKGNFADLVSLVNKGFPLPFGSVCNNKRSLVSLDNLIDLIILCIHHPAAANQVFLVADGMDLSTAQLLSYISKALDKPAKLIPVPVVLMKIAFSLLGKRNLSQRLLGSLQADITKTIKLLEWVPQEKVNVAIARAVSAMHLNEGKKA